VDQNAWNAVESHFAAHSLEDDPVLDEILRACEAAELPAIAISPLQGQFLAMLVRLTGATRILEIGTLGGYSATWMARALPATGRLISLEIDAHHADVARANLRRAGVGDRVEVLVDDAHRSLDAMKNRDVEAFDFVFLDADKASYPDYLEACLGLCRPGALIVADNVVRRGKIVDPNDRDPDTIGMRTFIERATSDPRLESAFLQTVGAKGWDGFAFLRVVG